MRDTTERISQEDLNIFYDRGTKNWPYNLVNKLVSPENKPKLPADWKSYIEEQLGFVANVCGYKSISIIKDMYKNNLSEKDIEDKYAISDNSSIYDIVRSGINIMKNYNSILYHGFEFCNNHRVISSEFKNIDFKPEEIKALNDINIWSYIQYIKNEDKIKSELGWSDGKYNHFRKQMDLDEIDQIEVSKKEDISIKDQIKSLIDEHKNNPMEIKQFINFANQIRKLVGLTTKSRTVSKSTKDAFLNLGYNVVKNKDEVTILDKEKNDMEAILNRGDSLNIFNAMTKKCLISAGINSVDDIPLDKAQLYKIMADNDSNLSSSVIMTAVNDTIDTLEKHTAPEVDEYKPLYTVDNSSIDIYDTENKHKILNELIEAYFNANNGELNRDDMEYIVSVINRINGWDSDNPWVKSIDDFTSIYKYIIRLTPFTINKIKNTEKYIIAYRSKRASNVNKVNNKKMRSKASNINKDEKEIKVKEENINNNIEIDDVAMKKAFEAFLRIPAVSIKDITVSIDATCPSCNKKLAESFKAFDDIPRIIYCPHCGCKLSF